MTEQTEAQKEYIRGLHLCTTVSKLENDLKDIKEGKKSNTSQDFNEFVSKLKTNNENPKFLIDGSGAHVEGEAKRYLTRIAPDVKGFFEQYGNQVIDNLFEIQNQNIQKSLEDITKELPNATEEEKKAIIQNVSVDIYEQIGKSLMEYMPNENADKEVKQLTAAVKNLESKSKDEIEQIVDKNLTEKYDLAYGTKGLHLNYNNYFEIYKQGFYRELGKKFVKVDDKLGVTLDKEAFKAQYGNEETIKKIAPAILANKKQEGK